MDFLRFCRTERYVSRLPLQNLQFCITLWRAPLIQEQQLEQLFSLTVPWGAKVLSPVEKLQKIQSSAGTSALATESCGCDTEGTTPERREGLTRESAAFAALKELQEEAVKWSCVFFTKPPGDDYMNEEEEASLVDPPQAPSPLVRIILHENDFQVQGGNKMHFMWAVGGLAGSSDGPLGDLVWKGREGVLCTVTAGRDDMYFTAKPSINKIHTLFVDSLYVYSFKITLARRDEPVSGETTPARLIRQIHEAAKRDKGRLKSPRFARRSALRRIVLQHSSAPPSNEVPSGLKGPSPRCFGRSSVCAECVRYHLFGVVERCTCVAADAVYLRCQWQCGAEGEDDTDGPWSGGALCGFTTQLALASGMIVDEFIPVSVHTFNVPFEYCFDGWGPTPLRLLITAYDDEGLSVGGPQSPIGYAALTVPHLLPGCHSLRTPLWRPRPTGREFVRSALLGGGPALVDVRDAGPRGEGGISVKCGLVSEPSGTVEVRVMVFHRVIVA